ncbi:MAG: hypothetical protein AMXMBFR48_11520 [Ignavibacteriales bacterium]
MIKHLHKIPILRKYSGSLEKDELVSEQFFFSRRQTGFPLFLIDNFLIFSAGLHDRFTKGL